MRKGNFAASYTSSYKIGCLVKVDVQHLLLQGKTDHPSPVDGCVDKRPITAILASNDRDDPIRAFALPSGWCAQECSFILRRDGKTEDDGWLVTCLRRVAIK